MSQVGIYILPQHRNSYDIKMTIDNHNCVFCRIIHGERDSATIFEDDSTLAFLDPRQSHEGHVLVIPKIHYEQIYDLDNDTASSLAQTVRNVARAVRHVYEPEGLSIWQSNGTAAFQEVPHVHWHVFPRYLNDGHLAVYPMRVVNRPIEFLKGISGPLMEALKNDIV